jgi:glycosyltransferase involved in cell wall biosynthesis
MNPPRPHPCQVLVVQNGARHNYAVPLALANHGMLSGFYTEAAGNHGLGRVTSIASRYFGLGKRLSRLKQRVIPKRVLPVTKTFPVSTLIDLFLERWLPGYEHSWLLGRVMQHATRQKPSIIYASMCWSANFLMRAKSEGIKIVSEFYLRPSLWKVYQDEYRLFPEWEATLPFANIEIENSNRLHPYDLADFLLAPTLSVKEDIIQNTNYPADQIYVVPYGVHPSFFKIRNTPIPKKILFVGSCTLAKGFHYFAKAAARLASQPGGESYQFMAAGNAIPEVRNQAECNHIEFLGRVPRDQIHHHYANADILVFPTLSDSFGSVMLEAMAVGIPVISSPYCADVVQDSINGFVVEPRDVPALAEAIQTITINRSLRNQMASAAKQRALEYNWQRHENELVETLSLIHSKSIDHLKTKHTNQLHTSTPSLNR